MNEGKGRENPSVQRYAKHVNPAFVKLLGTLGYGRAMVRGNGTRLTDDSGREYDDFLAAFGATNLGHNHPRLIAAITEHFASSPVNLVHTGPQVHAGDLAEALSQRTGPLTMCAFSSSGGEAVELALKIARGFTKRAGFLHCAGGFHGTNFGNLSVMGHPRLRAPFEPLLTGCESVAFGDLVALEKALSSKKHAAFIVEPIQAEAGVIVPKAGYLADAKQLCEKFGTLLVLDEVQTGLGRTGTMFAYEHDRVHPHVLVLGKALGGGLCPISAAITTEEIHQKVLGSMERFDLCSSTFSGNALACRVALETLRIIDEEKLIEAARVKGERLVGALHAAIGKHPLVREIRGKGLLVGLELGPTGEGFLQRFAPAIVRGVAKNVFGQWLSLRLLERGYLCQPASQQWDVLKIEPPLTIADETIDRFARDLGDLLTEYRDIGSVLADAGQRLGKQALSGWEFG
jgi:putrescine aminotransferase